MGGDMTISPLQRTTMGGGMTISPLQCKMGGDMTISPLQRKMGGDMTIAPLQGQRSIRVSQSQSLAQSAYLKHNIPPITPYNPPTTPC